MLFLSSSRQWESVFYTLFFKLPHKEKSLVSCVRSFNNSVALRADLSEILVASACRLRDLDEISSLAPTSSNFYSVSTFLFQSGFCLVATLLF